MGDWPDEDDFVPLGPRGSYVEFDQLPLAGILIMNPVEFYENTAVAAPMPDNAVAPRCFLERCSASYCIGARSRGG